MTGRGVERAALVAIVAAALVACAGDPGFGGRSSREWIAALESPDVSHRVEAARALGGVLRIDPRSPRVVEALIRTLNDADDQVRMTAASALVSQGVRAEGAVPGLHRAMHDSAHENVRAMSARVLGELRPTPPAASVAVLAEALDDRSAKVRAAAAAALRRFGQPARSAVPALLALLTDVAPDVRFQAVEALLALGASGEARTHVRALASHPDSTVRARAREVERKLDGSASR